VEEGARGPALAIDVLFGRFAIAAREPRNASPHVRGRGLRLTVAAPRLDLAHPVDDLRVRLDLPGAEVTDLAFYNAYLPAGSGVEVLSGAGRLRFGLEMETAHQSGRGDVVLTSKAVRVRFQDVELAGALDLRARLASSDLASRRFALDGTRLSLDRVAVRELGPEGEPAGSASSSFVVPPGWWARLELSRGTVELAKPLELASAFRADMKDSGLLLSLFARKRRYLGWFQKVLDIEGVTARGNLRFADGAIVIDPLHAAGGPIELRSRLRLARGHRRGVLLVRYGRLAAGVELRDGERTYRLRRPVEWYESQKAPW
jgi:hypothetical protein